MTLLMKSLVSQMPVAVNHFARGCVSGRDVELIGSWMVDIELMP
jgi:hypothetical protein